MVRALVHNRRLVMVAVVVLLASSLLVVASTSEARSGSNCVRRTSVRFTAAWTNDDGRVNGSDLGDVGDINPVYDRWGRRSSDDPGGEAMEPDRFEKDVAKCKAWVQRRNRLKSRIKVVNGYPGYVCTASATFANLGNVPLKLSTAAISEEPGITVTDITDPALPPKLWPGQSATVTYSVRIEQSAPQDERLHFDVDIDITKKRRRSWVAPRS